MPQHEVIFKDTSSGLKRALPHRLFIHFVSISAPLGDYEELYSMFAFFLHVKLQQMRKNTADRSEIVTLFTFFALKLPAIRGKLREALIGFFQDGGELLSQFTEMQL